MSAVTPACFGPLVGALVCQRVENLVRSVWRHTQHRWGCQSVRPDYIVFLVFLRRAGRRDDDPIVANFAAHRSVAVVVAVFVCSDRDDRDLVGHRVPQVA